MIDHQRPRRGRTGARSAGRSNRSCARSILWVVLAALAVWPRAAQGQWDRPIDWLIPCTAFIEETFGADHPLCDDVHPETGIKATLDAASLWLEGLGFASPAISANLDLAHYMQNAAEDQQALQVANQWDPRCEGRYCAWLVYGLGGKHGAYSWGDSSMALDPFRVTEEGLEPGYDDGFGFAEVHELFHAVQAGYSDVGAAWDSDYIGWILEGSAEHAALAAGRQIGMSVASSVWLRTYDRSLHVPPNEAPDSPDFMAWAYGSWEFFEFLGDYLGSEGEMSYLDYLFENLAPAQENGLEAVEAAVRRESGEGLYEAFPEFVTRRLDRPCYFSQLGTWNDLDCADGEDNEHRFSLAFPDTVRRLQHTASDVAANGYLVRMEVPEEKKGRLTIRVPPDQDEEYLHLAVDDMRRDAPGPTGRRNEYTTELAPGPHEFLVRLANVPRDLSGVEVSTGLDFAADDPAPIEFILVELDSFITFSVSGDAGGSQHAGLRLAGALGTDQSRHAQLEPGYCSVWINTDVQTGSPQPSISFTAMVRDGLRSEDYQIGDDQTIASWGDERRSPGVFFAALGTESDGPIGVSKKARHFSSQGGTLWIEIDGDRIKGTFSVQFKEQAPFFDYPRQQMAHAMGHFEGVLKKEGSLYTCPVPDGVPVRRQGSEER